MSKRYVLTEDELEALLVAYIELDALECYGVDNWENYGEHREDYMNHIEEDYINTLDDVVNELKKEYEVLGESK